MTRHRRDRIAKANKHRLEEKVAQELEKDVDPSPPWDSTPTARLGVPGMTRQPLHGHAQETGEVRKR